MKKHKPKYWKKKCDTLWSKIIRNPGYCAICGASDGRLHAHHLIHKQAVFFRHILDNGICLCAGCHLYSLLCSPHTTPWAFDDWMKEHRPEQYQWWSKNRYKIITGVTINYKEVYSVLKEQENK